MRAKDSVEQLREYEVEAGEAQPRLAVEDGDAGEPGEDLPEGEAEEDLRGSDGVGADGFAWTVDGSGKGRGGEPEEDGEQEAADHEA